MSISNQHCDYCDRLCESSLERESGLCHVCLAAHIESPFWTVAKVRAWKPFVTMRAKHKGYLQVPTYPDPNNPQWCRVGSFGAWEYWEVARVLNVQGVLNEPPAGHGSEADMYYEAKYPAKPPILGPQPEYWDVFAGVFHDRKGK